MSALGLDLQFATLIKNYLDHADSVAAGVPSAETLPRVLAKTAGNDVKAAQARITASAEGNGKGGKITVTVNVAGQLSASITAAVLSGYQKQIQDRLANSNAFYLWLHNQSEDDRTGFQITKYGLPRTVDVELMPEDKILQFPVVLVISIARFMASAD